jgi:hypothetical protein
MGLVLDSELQSFEVLGVQRVGEDVIVKTQERWHYGEKKIGSGEQVGEDSTDSYTIGYHLGQFEGVWKIARIEFLEPPKVGRTELPISAPAPQMHGQRSVPGAGPSGPEAGPRTEDAGAAPPAVEAPTGTGAPPP